MKKVKINHLHKNKTNILNLSKKIIEQNGWNTLLFKKISAQSDININDLTVLFPDGYIEMLKFALDQTNLELVNKCKKINLSKIPLHKRIKKILLAKFKIMEKEKKYFKRIFYFLLIPTNYKTLSTQLYKSIDLMWYIAGDNSTDFNFYTKRMILSGIYTSLIINFINNHDLNYIEEKLDIYLLKVSKIPKIKKDFQYFTNSFKSYLTFFQKA